MLICIFIVIVYKRSLSDKNFSPLYLSAHFSSIYFEMQFKNYNFRKQNLNLINLLHRTKIPTKMNYQEFVFTLQDSQPANFRTVSELLHAHIDFSQPPNKLELIFIEFFFTLVKSKIFQKRQRRKR